MTVTLHSTVDVITANGIPARIWRGRTANGLPVVFLVAAVTVDGDGDPAELAAELREIDPPIFDLVERDSTFVRDRP